MDEKMLANMVYVITKHEAVVMAHKVQGLNLEKARMAIERAQTTGPFLEPTLYRRAEMELHWDERLIKAALAFQLEAATIFREIELWERAQAEKEKQQDST